MKKQFYIFVIKDSFGEVFGIAPTKLEAKKQANWFLPRNKYSIEPMFVNMNRF